MGINILDDDGGSSDISKIEINEEFARRFEHNKKREDLQRYEELKKKGVISDSEEEKHESSDDDEEMVDYSTKQDLKFFDALIKIRNKDPSLKGNVDKLLDSDNEEEEEEEEGGGNKKVKEKKKKPMFLKDVNAMHLIENGPEFDDEDEEEDNKNRKKSYFEEQEEVRKEFLDAIAEEEEDDDGDFLKVKNDNKEGDGEDEDDREFEKKLDEYFKEDDTDEKFLKDYFRNKMWLEKDYGNSKGLPDDEIDVDEDEKELEKQEDYERDFNFRYEENTDDRVMGHSRKVESSVRKKENSRKIQRMNKKEKMAQAEFARKEELKHLKNVKKKELNEKLRKIREIAGFGENGDCLLDEHDLEEEFDPEEYDRKMKKVYDDKFYDADDVDPGFGSDEEDGDSEKPNFDKEDELLGLPKGWDEEYGFLAVREKTLEKKAKKGNENEERLQDENKKRKRSKLEAELIKKELEEVYKLEWEDTVEDLKTRFKYKPVNRNTYGLKAKEILLVDEKELNQIVPLKKLATYREDEFTIPRHKIKEHKKRIKSLIRGESSDGHTNDSKKAKHDVGQTETEKSNSDAENEDTKELSRKQRRKMRLKELKISDKRRMAYEGSTAKSNKKRKHKS